MGYCPVQRRFATVTDTSGHGRNLIHTEEVTGSIPVSPTSSSCIDAYLCGFVPVTWQTVLRKPRAGRSHRSPPPGWPNSATRSPAPAASRPVLAAQDDGDVLGVGC